MDNRQTDIQNQLATYLAKQEEANIYNKAKAAVGYLTEQILAENILEDDAINALINNGLPSAINDLYKKLYQKKNNDELDNSFNTATNPIKKLAIGKLLANKNNEPLENYLSNKTDALSKDNFLNNVLSSVKNDNDLHENLTEDNTDLYELAAALELLGLKDKAHQVRNYINTPSKKVVTPNRIQTEQNTTTPKVQQSSTRQSKDSKTTSTQKDISQNNSDQKQTLDTQNTSYANNKTENRDTQDSQERQGTDSDAKQETDKISTPHTRQQETKKQEKPDDKKDKTESPVKQTLDTAKKDIEKRVIKKGIIWLLKWLFLEPPQAIVVWGIIIILIIILLSTTTIMECIQTPTADNCQIILEDFSTTELESMKRDLSSDITENLDYSADATIGSSAESFTPNKFDIKIINQGLPN